jgi:hypothetical protein
MSKSGMIYKLVCNDLKITEYYVGSTCNFSTRKYNHKTSCTNEKGRAYNYNVYQFIREHGGWDNWDMIQVEECKFDNRRELAARERHWVETLHATLNTNVPNRQMNRNQKSDCEICGGCYSYLNKSTHLKTNKHLRATKEEKTEDSVVSFKTKGYTKQQQIEIYKYLSSLYQVEIDNTNTKDLEPHNEYEQYLEIRFNDKKTPEEIEIYLKYHRVDDEPLTDEMIDFIRGTL